MINSSFNTRRLQQVSWRVIVYLLLIMFALVFLLPGFLVVITALKTPAEAQPDRAWELPSSINFESFETAWEAFSPRLANSAILAVTATAASAVMGSLNGYVLAKWRIPAAGLLFPLMLFGMFIPYQAVLIPLFQFMNGIELFGQKLYGGLTGLILVHVVYGLPITTLIFRNFYVEIPKELIEAGQIDGAGFFGIYRNIIFPLSLPGFVVVVIWQFTQIWNEFLFAITLTSEKNNPITVPIANLAGGEAVDWNLPMAGAILAALPTLVVYMVLGRYFIRGLLAGSVKG